MNKERQRKLEARSRRQESLAAAFGTSSKGSTPIVEKKKIVDAVPKAISIQHENKHSELKASETKRGPGRPKKGNTNLLGSSAKKKTIKGERKNK